MAETESSFLSIRWMSIYHAHRTSACISRIHGRVSMAGIKSTHTVGRVRLEDCKTSDGCLASIVLYEKGLW